MVIDMDGTKSVTKNYMYNMVYQILILIIPIITIPFVSRTLQSTAIGRYSYTQSIVTYFILVGTIGIAMYGQREIAYVQDDEEKRSRLFWEIIILRAITVSITLVVFYFAYVTHGKNRILYAIQIIDIVANIFDISWFFQGVEDFKRLVVRNCMVKLICVAMIFIFIRSPKDLPLYVFCYSLSLIIGNLSLWFYLPKYVVKIGFDKLKILSHLWPALILFVPQIATQIYTVLDKTMLGKLAVNNAMDQVGYYEQAQKIVKLLLTIVTSLGTVMLPRMASIFAKKDIKLLNEYMDKSFRFTYMISFPLMLGLISISKRFVPVFYGSGYEPVEYVLIFISPVILFIGLSNVIGTQYQIPTGKQRDYTLSVVAGAISNFLLNLLLIPKFNAYGASVSTVMAEFIVLFVHFYCIRKDIDIKKSILCSKNYLIAGIVMFVAAFSLGSLPVESNILVLIIQIGTGVVVYFGVLFIMKDELLKQILRKVLKVNI
ncbi:MAG: flippase [Lachnospiraceae bacterium]|nr:flippase [Lachnospiraceae bacterium]MDE6252699.1 flippase [Lachnospiraceae bacterium]